MLDALVGAVIMVVATTSLLYSIEVSQKAINDAGQYELSDSEVTALEAVGIDDASARDLFLKSNLAWKQWGVFKE